jgi:dTMP kinase
MNDSSYNGKVVVFCGLDGTGKTTLFNRLRERWEGSGIQFIPRGKPRLETYIEQNYPRTFNDERDWTDAAFGAAISFACAVDGFQHYSEIIAPALAQNRIVVCDRYATCFTAFARMQQVNSDTALTLLQQVPHPDVVYYCTINEQTRKERILDRPGIEVHEVESEYCQAKFETAYHQTFREQGLNVITINNNGLLEETYAALDSQFRQYSTEQHKK